MNQLEDERIARKSIESVLSKLKEDFAKTDLTKEKYTGEIQIKFDHIKSERNHLEMELNKYKDTSVKEINMLTDKVSSLES